MATKKELLESTSAIVDDADQTLATVRNDIRTFARSEFTNAMGEKRQAFNALRRVVRATGAEVSSKARFDANGNRDDVNGKITLGALLSQDRASESAKPIDERQINNFASMLNVAIAGAEKNANLLSTLDRVFCEKPAGEYFTRKVPVRRMLAAASRICSAAKAGEVNAKLGPAVIFKAIDVGPKPTREDEARAKSLLNTIEGYVLGKPKATPAVAPIEMFTHELWVAAMEAVQVAYASDEATPKPEPKPTKSGKKAKSKTPDAVATMQGMATMSEAQIMAYLASRKK